MKKKVDYYKFFSLFIKMTETTYYQTNRKNTKKEQVNTIKTIKKC